MRKYGVVRTGTVAVVFGLLGIAGAAIAGGVSISGSQTAGGGGTDAKLECSPVTLAKQSAIVGISGSNGGFWITQGKGGGTVANYSTPNDASAKGKVLAPGSYCVYPNMPHDRKSPGSRASVTIELQ
ncbi:MAG: hypothetical protein H7833_03595 [Magnetococcus sp. DMHC-1]|nr:hypothetical protein [Magnetococcales bacterium]